jgi:hypothetical protein
MPNRRATTALAAGAALVTIALTAAAFWLSYEHLHDIAGGNGLTGSRAWAWPATVDLFIVTGELLVLRASLRQTTDWWAIALAALGSVGSIALNISGVGGGASVLAYVVAAVPPTAALVAFGALMRQVHEVLDRISDAPAPDARPHPDAETAPPAPEAPAPAAPAHSPGALELHLAPMLPASPEVTADAHPSAPVAPAPAVPGSTASDDELIEAARALRASGPLTLRRLQNALGIGQARAQRIRAAVDAPPASASEEAAS